MNSSSISRAFGALGPVLGHLPTVCSHSFPQPLNHFGVEFNLASKANCLSNGLGHFGNGHICAAAHIDVALHGAGMLVVNRFGQVHHMHTGCGHIVHIQKLSAGGAIAPNFNAGCVGQLGLVKAPEERWDDVAIFRVVVIARAIQVGWHDASVVHAMTRAVLTVVAFTQLDACNFGNGLGLIRRL